MPATGARPRIYFFTPFCVLRNTTNRIFDVRMVAAFAEAGCQASLYFPYVYLKENLPNKELHRYYGVVPSFSFRMLRTPLAERFPGAVKWLIMQAAFLLATVGILLSNAGRLGNVVIVSRDTASVLPALVLKKIFGKLLPVRIVPQLHELKGGALKRFGYRGASGLMVNVQAARDDLERKFGISSGKIFVMHAPMVDFSKTDCSKEDARRHIGYSGTEPLVVYTGKISRKAKELVYLLEAARQLPKYKFLLTGGKRENLEPLGRLVKEMGLKNIVFTGFLQEASAVRLYQLAADVLVSYYTARDHLVKYNYPQKLQEYLSTNNPVVTPLFEATRGVIDESHVFAVAPDDPEALAGGIREAVVNKALAAQKAEAAFQASRKVTYDYKVREFLAFFDGLS
jgi:glycosyltransferase involved in cell wall biosynthesis